jgi:hypothetical protein
VSDTTRNAPRRPPHITFEGGRPVAEPEKQHDEKEPGEKITRADIEAKFRELTGDVEDKADAAKGTAVTIGAVVVVAVVLGVFLFGRARGRKKTTVIEVRRY